MNGNGGDYIGKWGLGKLLPCSHEALCLIFSITTGKKTNTVSVFRWFHPPKVSKLHGDGQQDGVVRPEKGGSGALMLSEDGAAALPDGKAPKTGHTGWAHLLSHSFRVANFIFA